MKVIFKFLLFLNFIVCLSLPLHAMKRKAEDGENEPWPKRLKLSTYRPLPKRFDFLDSDLIDEIKADKVYIEQVMYKLFEKLHRIAWEKNLDSPEQCLAWMQTMYTIVYKAYNTAWKIGSDSSYDLVDAKPHKIALKESVDESKKSSLRLAVEKTGIALKAIDGNKIFMAENYLGKVHNNKIWNSIKKQAQEIVDNKIQNIEGQNAYKIAVDEVFKLLLLNFTEIFNKTHDFYIQNPIVSTRFGTQKILNEWCKSFIDHMTPAELSFLAPWLVHFLPFDALLLSQRPLCTTLWADTYVYPRLYSLVRPLLIRQENQDPVLPLDLINMISNFVMRKLIATDLYPKQD